MFNQLVVGKSHLLRVGIFVVIGPVTKRTDIRGPIAFGGQPKDFVVFGGIKQAKTKPMRKVTMAEVQTDLSPNLQKIEKMYVPQKSKNTEFLEGSPAEVAKKLVEKLKNEVRVL